MRTVVVVALLATLPVAARAEILVFAGAGFRLPIEEAAIRFGERHGERVEVTFAGSGCLLAQAELAGRGDVFIPGELHYLTQAQARGLAGEAVPIAYLSPVIAVARGNPHSISSLADLAREKLRVGLGDVKSVAVGVAAERWMRAALTPDEMRAIEQNVRTRAINVNELGSQLSLGALDAAIVWDVTVTLFGDLESISPPGAREHRTIITGGVLSSSDVSGTAERFLAFLVGEEGAEIFRSYGYEPYEKRGARGDSGSVAAAGATH